MDNSVYVSIVYTGKYTIYNDETILLIAESLKRFIVESELFDNVAVGLTTSSKTEIVAQLNNSIINNISDNLEHLALNKSDILNSLINKEANKLAVIISETLGFEVDIDKQKVLDEQGMTDELFLSLLAKQSSCIDLISSVKKFKKHSKHVQNKPTKEPKYNDIYARVKFKTSPLLDIDKNIAEFDLACCRFCTDNKFIRDIVVTSSYDSYIVLLLKSSNIGRIYDGNIEPIEKELNQQVNTLLELLSSIFNISICYTELNILRTTATSAEVFSGLLATQEERVKSALEINERREHSEEQSCNTTNSNIQPKFSDYTEVSINTKLLSAITDKLSTSNIFSSSDEMVDYILKQYLLSTNS